MVIGLDCAPPELVFHRFRDAMPHVHGLMTRGMYGPMRSSVPPITVPAWTCMTTGRDPGELGIYGFRNRVPQSYEQTTARAESVREKRIWDFLGEQGYRVAPLFVPLTYPAPSVRGVSASGFLTPEGAPFTFPESLGRSLESRFGPYQSDVRDFRTSTPATILAQLYASTKQHFDMALDVWRHEHPDFMMMVEMGTDRFHHAFFHHIEPTHPAYDPSGPFKDAGREYYHFVDRQIGRLLKAADPDTTVMVVSDHGARVMEGGLCINEWLIEQGYLVLKRPVHEVTTVTPALIDWTRTKAWGEGGYYARVNLNLMHREPNGIVPLDQKDALLADLRRDLDRLAELAGASCRVEQPEHIYRSTRGFAPDLLVFFGDLRFRSIGSVGHGRFVVPHDDRGQDTCNHDWNGIFVMGKAGQGDAAHHSTGQRDDAHHGGPTAGIEIYDVQATIAGLFDLDMPDDLLGRDWS